VFAKYSVVYYIEPTYKTQTDYFILPLYHFIWTVFAPDFIQKNDKVHPRTRHIGPEGEQRYSSTLSLTSALDAGGWSTPRPSRFTPAKESRYQLYRRLGGLQGWFGPVRQITPPPGLYLWTVQAVASRCSD